MLWPLSVLTGVLGRDRAFRDHCAGIAAGPLSVEDVARRYVRWNSSGRRVIEHLLRVGETLLRVGAPRGVAMLSSECSYTVSADEPLASNDRRRWVRSNAQHKRGAELLALLGAGVCLKDGCLTYPRKGGPYCSLHDSVHDSSEAAVRVANRRAMRLVLKEAEAGLDLVYANSRSVAASPPIASSAGEPPLLQKVGARLDPLRVRTEDEAEYQRLMAAAPTPEQEQRHRDLLHALHAREQEREAAAEAEAPFTLRFTLPPTARLRERENPA